MMIPDESIICWNCRRAKSKNFLREMKELKRIYMLMIIIIIEPKINGREVNEVCKKIGKTHWSRRRLAGSTVAFGCCGIMEMSS